MSFTYLALQTIGRPVVPRIVYYKYYDLLLFFLEFWRGFNEAINANQQSQNRCYINLPKHLTSFLDIDVDKTILPAAAIPCSYYERSTFQRQE